MSMSPTSKGSEVDSGKHEHQDLNPLVFSSHAPTQDRFSGAIRNLSTWSEVCFSQVNSEGRLLNTTVCLPEWVSVPRCHVSSYNNYFKHRCYHGLTSGFSITALSTSRLTCHINETNKSVRQCVVNQPWMNGRHATIIITQVGTQKPQSLHTAYQWNWNPGKNKRLKQK